MVEKSEIQKTEVVLKEDVDLVVHISIEILIFFVDF